jgi:hypothetical protein
LQGKTAEQSEGRLGWGREAAAFIFRFVQSGSFAAVVTHIEFQKSAFIKMPIIPTEIDRCLREYFNFQAFRQGQRELIEAVLTGKDSLGVLPAGGGKSLACQLPAVLLPGLTIAVSPLIALIKDAGTVLAASTLANILRGASKSSFVAKHPELLTLTQFGAEKDRTHDEVLLDFLTMWAKGYLRPASDQNKRLELSPKGHDAAGKSAGNSLH